MIMRKTAAAIFYVGISTAVLIFIVMGIAVAYHWNDCPPGETLTVLHDANGDPHLGCKPR